MSLGCPIDLFWSRDQSDCHDNISVAAEEWTTTTLSEISNNIKVLKFKTSFLQTYIQKYFS